MWMAAVCVCVSLSQCKCQYVFGAPRIQEKHIYDLDTQLTHMATHTAAAYVRYSNLKP